MDSSGSIEKAGKGNYKKCLDFIKTAVNGSFISETFTHAGLVVFSSKVCGIPHFTSDINITDTLSLKLLFKTTGADTGFCKREGGGGGCLLANILFPI